MPRRLTLICHAATAATRTAAFPLDEPAEAAGLAKAALVAGTLPHFDTAWCSPSLVARQTATALGLSARPDASLRDREMGDLAGHDPALLDAATLQRWRSDPAWHPPGGESLLDLSARIGAWLDGLAPERSCAVTHPSVIRAAIIVVLGAPPSTFWSIDVPPLARVSFSSDGRRWALRLQ